MFFCSQRRDTARQTTAIHVNAMTKYAACPLCKSWTKSSHYSLVTLKRSYEASYNFSDRNFNLSSIFHPTYILFKVVRYLAILTKRFTKIKIDYITVHIWIKKHIYWWEIYKFIWKYKLISWLRLFSTEFVEECDYITWHVFINNHLLFIPSKLLALTWVKMVVVSP